MSESDPQHDEENFTSLSEGMAVSAPCAPAQTLIAIATYNEILNLPSLIDELSRIVPEADLLVIDDNSPDGTGEWCQRRSETDPRFRCLRRSGKLGLGTASIEAMRYAVDREYAFLLTLDADWSHPPAVVPQLLAAMEGDSKGAAGSSGADHAPADRGRVDVAIGSRYVPGGSVEGWPWRRRQMSRIVNSYARLLLRLKIRDTSGAFRCYRVSLLRQLDLSDVRSRGYSFYEEILWRLRRAGARMVEIPITFTERARGESKINLREAMTAVHTIARLGLGDWLGKS